MLYNREYYRKVNDKKLLHKVGKHWATISISVLAMLGGASLLGHSAHADTTPSTTTTVNASPAQQNSGQQQAQSKLQQSNELSSTDTANTEVQPQQTTSTQTGDTQTAQNTNGDVPAQNVQNSTEQASQQQSVSSQPQSIAPQQASQESAVNAVPSQASGSVGQNVSNSAPSYNIANSSRQSTYSPSSAPQAHLTHIQQSTPSHNTSVTQNQNRTYTQNTQWHSTKNIQQQAKNLHSILFQNNVTTQPKLHLNLQDIPNEDTWPGQMYSGASSNVDNVHSDALYNAPSDISGTSQISTIASGTYAYDTGQRHDTGVQHTYTSTSTSETTSYGPVTSEVPIVINPSGNGSVSNGEGGGANLPTYSLSMTTVETALPSFVSRSFPVTSDIYSDIYSQANNTSNLTYTRIYRTKAGNDYGYVPTNNGWISLGTNEMPSAPWTLTRVSEHIQFNGDPSADTSLTGNNGSQGHVNAPNGYHFTNGATGDFTYTDNGTASFDVAENNLTDQIHYVLSGNNIPSNYQGQSGQLGSISLTGLAHSGLNTNQLQNVPANYHIIGTPSLTYDGQEHDIQIAPNSENLNITYTDQNGKTYSGAINGAYDQKLNDVTTSYNLPNGYHLNGGQDASYVFNGNTNQSKDLSISGNQQNSNVQITIKKYDGSTPKGTSTISVPESGLTGNSWSINPNQYAPSGYRAQQGVLNGTFTPNGVSQNNATFTYSAQAGSAITVNYINQDNARVGTGTITGNVDDQGNIGSKVGVPSGYTVNGNQPSTYHMTANAQAPINIQVTGLNSSNISGNGTFTITVQKSVNGHVISSNPQQIHINGKVGDNYTVTPSNYTPVGYTSTSNPVQGTISPQGLTTSNGIFVYTANAGDSIDVTYKDQSGQVIRSGSIKGMVDSTGNVYLTVPMPNGYHYVSSNQAGANATNIPYHISTTPQDILISVEGNSNVPSGHIAIPFNPNNQNNHSHNSNPSDVPNTSTGGIPSPIPYDPQDANDTFYVTVTKYRHNGQVGGYMKRYTINGNVGDHFTIDPNSFTPAGYHESDDNITNGQIGVNGLEPNQVTYKYAANAFNPNDKNNPNAADAITIHYVDDVTGHTIQSDMNAVTGETGEQGSILPGVPVPAGYNVDPNQNTNYTITEAHQTQRINVAPIHQTDHVHFELTGGNVPSGYQGKTGIVYSDNTDYSGNDARAIDAGNNHFNFDPHMKGVPSHLHATGIRLGDNTNYDGNVHTIEVAPDDENLNVTYVDQNGNKHESAINGAYDQTVSDITGDVPAGYHANQGQDVSYTFNSDQNQGRTIDITGNQQSDTVTTYIDRYNGNQFDGQSVKTIPVSGLTGNTYTIDPNSLAPAGYRSQDGILTGTFTPNGASNGSVTFKYNAQAGTAINVNYINQDGKSVKHGTISGNVNDTGLVVPKVPLPAGYAVDSGQPSSYRIQTNAQAPINIHVTGADASTLPDHGQFQITINKVVNGHVISSQQEPVQVHGKVGNLFVITPSNYTPANYTSTSNPVQGSINATGLTPDNATFRYVATAGDTVTVSYKNQNGKIVKTGSINGDVDSTGNAVNAVSVPSDYDLQPNQNTSYKISADPQSMTLNVVGKPAQATINFVDQNGHPAGSVTVHGRAGDTVSPSSYPAGFAKPNPVPQYTFHHAGQNPAMGGVTLHGENAGDINGSKNYKPQIPDANGVTTDPTKDTNNPLNPNSKNNKGDDTANGVHGYATINIVKVVNGHIASENAVPVSENNLDIGDNYVIKSNDPKLIPYGYKPEKVTQLNGSIMPTGSLSNDNASFFYDVDPSQISPMHIIYRNKFNADLAMNGDRITQGYSAALTPVQLATLGASGDSVNILKLLKAPFGYDFAKDETYNIKLVRPTTQHPYVTVTVAVSDTQATDSANTVIHNDRAATNTDSANASKAASTASTAGLTSGAGVSEMSHEMSIISSASAAIHNDSNGGIPYESNANAEMASAAQAYNTMNSLASSAVSASESASASRSAVNANKNHNQNSATSATSINSQSSSTSNNGLSSYESEMDSIINSEIASDEAANAKNAEDQSSNSASDNGMNQMNAAEMAALESGLLNPNINDSANNYMDTTRRDADKAFKEQSSRHSYGKNYKSSKLAARRALRRVIARYINAHRNNYQNGSNYMNGTSSGMSTSDNNLTNAQIDQITNQMGQMMSNPESANSLMNQAHQINTINPSATASRNSNGTLPQTGEAGPSYADLMAAIAIAFSMAMMALGYDVDKRHNS